MIDLNQEALGKAYAAADEASPTGRAYSPGILSAIRTYLASLPPVDANDLVERLQERAGSYRSSGPSAEHTAILLDEAAAAIIALQCERDAYRDRCARNRWNIDEDGRDLLICRGDHEKGEKCELERYVPHETVAAAETEVRALASQRDEWQAIAIDSKAEVARLTDERDSAWGEIDTYRNMAARKSSEKAEAAAEVERLKAELAEALRIAGERFDADKPVIEQYEKGWLDCVEHIRHRLCEKTGEAGDA